MFRVFEDAGNLGRITPPWLNFVVATEGVEMREGALIDYTIRWLGLPMKWKTLITEYDPPHSFTDLQLRGPYRLWRHRHIFEQTAEGTIVTDQVDYCLPLGALGRLAHAAMVKRQLLAIFNYRQGAMPRLLNAPLRRLADPEIVARPATGW